MNRERIRALWPRLLFLCLVLGSVALSVLFLMQGLRAVESAAAPAPAVLVIDPGHGGIDGGAVSDDGSKESDINLAIALRLRAVAEFLGVQTVMTRSDDSIRESCAEYSERRDLLRRIEVANSTPGAVLISIHQNDFPTSQPSGSQVLYAATDGSKVLGELCHRALIAHLNPENRRVAEPAPKWLLLTSQAQCPAILVECGFMSNNFDVQKLCNESYQRAIALILAASFMQYINGEESI